MSKLKMMMNKLKEEYEMKADEIKMKVSVDTEELEDAGDLITDLKQRINSTVPNVTIRNNQNVYVTINNYAITESDKDDSDRGE